MRIVPVIDLLAGRAVQARGGDRRLYRPLASRLAGGNPEPLDEPASVAARLVLALRSEWIYVADLDAIDGTGDNLRALPALRDAAGTARLLWDGGFADRAACARLPDRLTPILASETLAGIDGLSMPPGTPVGGGSERAGDDRRAAGAPPWIGLDLTATGMRVASAEVGALGEEELLRRAVDAGAAGAVVVCLDRIGSGTGLPIERLTRLRTAAPGIPICAGGGIATLADLAILRDAGFDGALVATALHDGRVTPAALHAAGFV